MSVMELNLDRMVRSATAGTAGEPYCAFILDQLEVVDFSGWSLRSVEALWERAAASALSVDEFVAEERNRIREEAE
jgi:hypothetical protein